MDDADPPLLRADRLSYRYSRGRWGLSGVSAAVDGSVVAVLGPNGAGKTTLLSLVTGILRPTVGSVSIAGLVTDRARERRQLQRELGFVPQAASLFPGYTVQEVLRYVAWLRKVAPAQVDSAIAWSLQAVDLTELRTRRVRSLSGGMRQRLLVAQALVNYPRVVVLDEPTVGLDPEQRRRFLHLIEGLAGHCKVVLATHLVEDVAAVCDAVLLLGRGESLFTGSVPQLVGCAGANEVTGPAVEAGYRAVLAESEGEVPRP